jgi:hypothetical protein
LEFLPMPAADYLEGIPTLPPHILRKLHSGEPLTAAEEEFADVYLQEHIKPALNQRLIDEKRFVRDGDPTRPHLHNAKTGSQPYKPHRRYLSES